MEIDPNLDQLATSLANLGKRWWFFAVMGQFAVIILGMVGAVWGQAAWPLVLIAGGLSILVGFVQWRADRLKRAADTVRRKFEMHKYHGIFVTKCISHPNGIFSLLKLLNLPSVSWPTLLRAVGGQST